jgi:hypothetical protein
MESKQVLFFCETCRKTNIIEHPGNFVNKVPEEFESLNTAFEHVLKGHQVRIEYSEIEED